MTPNNRAAQIDSDSDSDSDSNSDNASLSTSLRDSFVNRAHQIDRPIRAKVCQLHKPALMRCPLISARVSSATPSLEHRTTSPNNVSNCKASD
jgi:hypothetical protein